LMVMNHRIIAVVGKQVKKVECLTCHAVHAYKAAVGSRQQTSSSPEVQDARPKRGKDKVTRPPKSENEWNVFMTEMPPEHQPRLYRVSESYLVSEFIEHPAFGFGRVLEITGAEKMVVIFKDGRKTLLCNRSPRQVS
jgi:hypothetical protein